MTQPQQGEGRERSSRDGVLRNPKSFINFIIAIFLIQTLLCLVMTCAEVDRATAYHQTTQTYDYHIKLRGITQPQYAKLHNLDSRVAQLAEQMQLQGQVTEDIRRALPYRELRYEELEDGGYNVYVVLWEDDLELEAELFLQAFVMEINESANPVVVAYSPLYNYGAYYAVNIGLTVGFAVFFLLVLAVFLLLNLYSARLNHERFQYGIYMVCGAGFRQLFFTAAKEMMSIVLLTYVPSVLLANGVALMLYWGTESLYYPRVISMLLTLLFSALSAWVAVWLPMKRLSRQAPVTLLHAQDNTNLVTSPRRSLHVFGRSFPFHYELFSLWRYRRYLAGLLLSSLLFASLWLGLTRVSEFQSTLEQTSSPEFAVQFHPATVNAEALNQNVEKLATELEAIEGVLRATYRIETKATEALDALLFTPEAAKGAASYTLRHTGSGTEHTAATDDYSYVALNEAGLARLQAEYDIVGDPTQILTDDHAIIISTSLYSKTRFALSPGDTVMIADCMHAPDPSYITANSDDMLLMLLSEGDLSYDEYRICAVIRDETADEKLTVGVGFAAYKTLTGVTPYTSTVNVYLTEDCDFTLLRQVEEEVQAAANGYYSTTVRSYDAFYDRYLTQRQNTPGRTMVSAYLILVMMPLLCFFSQRVFYRKREQEWYILRALGASRAERLRLLLFSGAILTVANFAMMAPLGLLADFIAYKVCAEWLPAGGFLPSTLMKYSIPPQVFPVLLVFALVCGMVPCLIAAISMRRGMAQEDVIASVVSVRKNEED